MKQYEVTFIVDPVLSSNEISSTAAAYIDLLKDEGCEIVHINEMGLRQLAYPINKRTSGVYYCIEFKCPAGSLIGKLELALRRDERIMRFLTMFLDKYGIKYNADKRAGLIGKKKKENGDKKIKPAMEEVAVKETEPVRSVAKKEIVQASSAKEIVQASSEEEIVQASSEEEIVQASSEEE